MKIKCACGNEAEIKSLIRGGEKAQVNGFCISIDCHNVKLEIKCLNCGREIEESDN